MLSHALSDHGPPRFTVRDDYGADMLLVKVFPEHWDEDGVYKNCRVEGQNTTGML